MSTINFSISLLFLFFILSCEKKSDLKKFGLSSINQSQLSYKGAVDRSIQLDVKIKKASISTINAHVTAPYHSSEAHHFQWTLGPNVELVEGQLKGQMNLVKNESEVIQIKVKNFDSIEKKFIRFEITGQNQKRITFVDAIISSDQKDSFEEIVKEVELIKKENAE